MVGFVSWALDVPSVRREGYKDTRGPGHDAVCRIIEVAAAGPSVKALRDVAMLRLLYDLALRCGEVVSLDVSHVDIPGRRLSILGKGRQDREYLTLPVSTAAALSAWLEVRGSESGPLFLSSGRGRSLRWSGRMDTRNLYGLVRRLGESVGVRTWPHGLRHTAITEVIKMAQQNGVGLDECCQYSRHKDVKTLMIYRDKERDVQGTLASFLSERVQLDVVP
jgi:integrase/recombinase XerC